MNIRRITIGLLVLATTVTAFTVLSADEVAAQQGSEVCLEPIGDTFVRSDQANTNFGGETGLSVAWWEGSYQSRTYLQFDLSSLPAEAEVESAQLELYLNFSELDPLSTVLEPAAEPWGENSLTWNTKPGGLGTEGYELHGGTEGWKVWDATSLVQGWLQGTSNNGIIVRAEAPPLGAEFAAREGAADRAPALCVTYSVPPESDLLTAEEAAAEVEGEDRLEEELLDDQPTEAVLIDVPDGTEFVPKYWLVLLEDAEGTPSGVVGIDPYSGELGFEHFVGAGYRFPQYDPDRTRQLLLDNGMDPANYRPEGAGLVWLGGKVKANLWFIPAESGELADALALTAFDRAGKLYSYLPVDPLFETEHGEAMYAFPSLWEWASLTDWALREGDFEEEPPGDVVPPDDASTVGASDTNASSTGSSLTTEPMQAEADLSIRASGCSGGQCWNTDLVSDVPFYQQGNTQWCALFGLSMMHQWWSPLQLGTGSNQASELGSFLGHGTNQGTTMSEMDDIITQWDVINTGYQDFQTTFSGVGQHPIQDGNPALKTDDIKSWIALDAPVAATTDSDGGGSGAMTDHVVVVIGYDDRKDKIWIHNSGAFLGKSGRWAQGTVSYNDWNNKFWSAKWWDVPVFNKNDRRYGLIGGYPGDMDRASFSTTDGDVLGLSTKPDDERVEVANIGLGVANDGAKGGSDAFGQDYETTVRLDFQQGGGWFEDETLGDFDRAGAPTFSFHYDTGLNQGSTIGGGGVYVDPADPTRTGYLGQTDLRFTYTIFDRDDRNHYQGGSLTVFDDRGTGTNNTSMMPKPALYKRVSQVTHSYTVEDDDTSGPHFTNFQPGLVEYLEDDNWPSGDLRLQADIQDASGIRDVTFHYEVYAPSGAIVHSDDVNLAAHGSGTYHYDVPRSEWYNEDRVEWWFEATDDDNDRPNDESEAESTTNIVHLVDDDVQGPSLVDYDHSAELATIGGQELVSYTLKVKLNDPSGVLDDGTYPTVFYRWGTSNVTETVNDGSIDADYDGDWYKAAFTAPAHRRTETLYWRVKAVDMDNDRSPSVDRSTSWTRIFQLDIPPELCVTPASIDHDFGLLSNVSGGKLTAEWPIVVGNCGGSSLEVFAEVSEGLENTTGSTPSCPLGLGHCWLGASGIPSPGSPGGGERLYGGDRQTVTVRINTWGFDYQVPILNPGRYEGVIRLDTAGGERLTGTIQAAIPQITVTAPHHGAAWEDGETYTITWQSMYMPGGTNVALELSGPASHVIDASTADNGSYAWTVPSSGLPDGQYRVEVNPVGLPTMAGRSEPFWIGNAPPVQPVNQSPAEGEQGVSSTPVLTGSAFSDSNPGDAQQAAQWQIRGDTLGTSQYSSPRWDTMTDTTQLRSARVPTGVLPAMASAGTRVTVRADEYIFTPERFEVTRGQLVTLTLENQGTVSHSLTIPELEVSTPVISPGDTVSITFTPDRVGEFTFHCRVGNHEQLGMVGRIEVKESIFWWRVRHLDSQGAWSPWSDETSFSTVYNPPASKPGGLLNFGQVVADFRRLRNLTISYQPLHAGDIGFGGANAMGSMNTQGADGLRYAGVAFDLTATTPGGEPVTDLPDTYTLTVTYEDWQWQNRDIKSDGFLNLYWDTGTGWEPILPCSGCSHDREGNTFTARLDHLTEFALLSAPVQHVYLPDVVKSAVP